MKSGKTKTDHHVPLMPICAGWVLMLGLVVTTVVAADEIPASPSLSTLSLEPVIVVPSVASANSDTIELEGTADESRVALFNPLASQFASVPTRAAGNAVRKPQAAGYSAAQSPSAAVLCLLFFCVLLLVAIAHMVRKLHNVNSQLERRSVDLSRGNDQMKKEVAERRLTEQALRVSESFYSSLVETVPQNIFRKDLEGKYTFANRVFCATLGKSAEEVIGKTDQDLVPGELAARFRREDEQVLESSKQIETEQNYPIPGGGKLRVQVIKTPLFDSEGRPIGIQGIFWVITERKRAGKELEFVHRQLIESARQVGMAEVATGVLHNVGNVLNSVNVSATLVCEQVKKSRVLTVGKVAALLAEHADEPNFLIDDPRGKQLPGYLKDLTEHLRKEQTVMVNELHSLVKNIEHIREIVSMQQSYAKLSGLKVAVKTSDVVEDALRMNSAALTRHEVQVVREYRDDPNIIVDKHKVLQTLVNLIRNAKHACDESTVSLKQIKLRICRHGNDRVRIQVEDNGVGIPRENLGRIFTRGFTTRPDGHGFGLHSCLMATQEMDGALTGHSDGPGLGAVFTLDLPFQPKGTSA